MISQRLRDIHDAKDRNRMPATESGLAPDSAQPRGKVDAAHRWALSDIYESWSAWEHGRDTLKKDIEAFGALKGTLQAAVAAAGADYGQKLGAVLLKVFRASDALSQLLVSVYYYPSLMFDEDQRDAEISARRQGAQALLAKATEAAAWLDPELLALGQPQIDAAMKYSDDLAVYRFAVSELFRKQAHILPDEGEQLLSLAARFNQAPGEAYGALTTADIDFPDITLSTGKTLTLTYGNYRKILATERNQSDRKLAFDSFYKCFSQHQHTYASLYQGVCLRDMFLARARSYESTAHASLFSDAVPLSVVENLIAAAKACAPQLQRYHQLRKKRLGLEEYHLYDSSIPLAKNNTQYPYNTAKQYVVESTAPLGEAYQQTVVKSFESGWIDVYENKGKRSGAYSAGVYGVHPYMLLNHNDTLDAVFTLAHEMGHSLHTVLAEQTQPYPYADYTIFVAEVASTLNEGLLFDYMIDRAATDDDKTILLTHAIDGICGTFFSQVMFADWELTVHRLVEAGKPVTADVLSEIYSDLLTSYYGDAVTIDEAYKYTWARIPHFYRSPYYVYQYATSFAVTSALRKMGLRYGKIDPALKERYLDLLRAGGSDQPMRLIAKAGVDLNQQSTLLAVGDLMSELLDQL